MKFNLKVPGTVTRSLNKALMSAKKASPTIAVVAGGVAVVAGVIACGKASTKLSEITEKYDQEAEQIHLAMEHPEEVLPEGAVYDEETGRRDLFISRKNEAIDIAKLYLPTVALVAGGLGLIMGGHRAILKRNAALVTAYTAIDQSFKKYRANVVERFGKDVDRELKYNIKAHTVKTEEVDAKGKIKVNETIIEAADANEVDGYSPYAVWFTSEHCIESNDNMEYDLMYLDGMRAVFNDQLHAKGHLFLNEVFDALGHKRTQIGQVAGWVYDKNADSQDGDGNVDFEIIETYVEDTRYESGFRKAIIVEFNCDGRILEKL